jgi:hypothetical protein
MFILIVNSIYIICTLSIIAGAYIITSPILSAIYKLIFNKNYKRGYQAKFSEWKKHLKIWEEVINKYWCNVINDVNNKKQTINYDNHDVWHMTCFSKNNKKEYLKIAKYAPRKIYSLADYIHRCYYSNINYINFFINTSDSKAKYSYRIIIYPDGSFAFNKCIVKQDYPFSDGYCDNVGQTFSSSEEMFADYIKEYENQKLLELFS